ncbi:uncharacterized protein LOC122381524 [Amphibalanus amphitrite]|uniref:uncharacterized protein LOC122381524 n=1 Tax=Amphibalanus amphitrite TaxID=1232801 RepID=UPI001C903648|nr:uncharacterized protein LOC122381524 [Amphibalanus amphitrite]
MAPRWCHRPSAALGSLVLVVVVVVVFGRSIQATPVLLSDASHHSGAFDLYNDKDRRSTYNGFKNYNDMDRQSTYNSLESYPGIERRNTYNDVENYPDIDQRSSYNTFENYIAYPPYSASSNYNPSSSYSSSSSYSPSYSFNTPSNSYGPPRAAAAWAGWGGWAGSFGGSGGYSGNSGGYSGNSGGYSGVTRHHVLRLEPRCDCAPIDLLALLSGGTALCALGIFCILQATGGFSFSTGNNVSIGTRQLLEGWQLPDGWQRFDTWQLPEREQLPGRLEWLRRQLASWLLPAIEQLSDRLLQLPEQQLADRVTAVTCRMAGQLETEHPGRSGRCTCYSGLLGALTGFASLGGLIVYALQLASAALTSSGGSGRAQVTAGSADRGAGEALSSLLRLLTVTGYGADLKEDGRSGSRSAESFRKTWLDGTGWEYPGALPGSLDRADLPCVPYQLCDINRQAAGFGPTRLTVTRLASLPVSWLLSRSGHAELSFGRLCSALQGSSENLCHSRYPQCDITPAGP